MLIEQWRRGVYSTAVCVHALALLLLGLLFSLALALLKVRFVVFLSLKWRLCGGLRWWGHPFFYIRGNSYNIWYCLRYYLVISFFWHQKFRWRNFLSDDVEELIYQYEVSYQCFRFWYRNLSTLFSHNFVPYFSAHCHTGQGTWDFVTQVLLSKAVQYWRHIENVFN